MSECPHKTLRKKLVAGHAYYQCEMPTCRQKFKAEPWDGKAGVTFPAITVSQGAPPGCTAQALEQDGKWVESGAGAAQEQADER
jgi:hypothetical protein